MKNQNIVPQIDARRGHRTIRRTPCSPTRTFPGAANADLTNARALYALLTGRVTQHRQRSPARRRDRPVRLHGCRPNRRSIRTRSACSSRTRGACGRTLTVNAGLRWQVAFPFQANTSVYSMNTFADLCGVSGPGNGPGGRGCNLFNPGVFNPGGRVPIYEQYNAGKSRLQDRLQQFRAERRRRVAAQRADRLAAHAARRPQHGDGAGELRRRLQQRRPELLHRRLQRQPRQHGRRRRDRRRARSSRWCRRRDLAGAAARAGRLGPSPGIPAAPVYPMAINFNSGVNLFDPDFRTPLARSYSVGLQRALSRLMAVEVRYVGTRLVDGPRPRTGTQLNFTSNGFLDEFRLAQQNLQVAIAQGCGQTGATGVLVCLSGTRHRHQPAADLSRELQRHGAARRPETPARYTGANWTNTARLDGTGGAQSQPRRPRSTLCTATRRSAPTCEPAGLPRNFFVLNPDVNNANDHAPTAASRSTTRCRSTCAALLSGGLDAGRQLHARRRATRRRSNDLRVPRLARPVDRRRAAGAQGHRELRAAVRPRPAVRRRHATRGSTRVVGGWSLNLTGRVQSGSILNFGNVRVVGMIDRRAAATRSRSASTRRHRHRLHAAAGHHRQHDQGLQHERDLGRPATARSARRPAATGAGQRPGLHPGGARRLRAARRLRRGPDLHARST